MKENTPYLEEKLSLKLPLGYSPLMGGAYPDTPFKKIKDAFNDFETIQFIVEHLDVKTYRIEIIRKRVPTAQYHSTDITETVTGLIGDYLRLKSGIVIRLVEPETSTLLVNIYIEKKT